MQQSVRLSTEPPTVFARFLHPSILAEKGRLLYALLNAFSMAGYRIHLSGPLPASDPGKYGRLVCDLDQVMMTDSLPGTSGKMIYLFDEEDQSLERMPWRKKIRVGFDIFSPYWLSDPILMPFPLHPVHSSADLAARLERYRWNGKKVRLLFAGTTNGYTRNRINYPAPKLSRLEVVQTILERLGDGLLYVSDQATLDRLFDGAYADRCAILDSANLWIDDRHWLDKLAKAEFFLCPPGITMPMCHNTVEAMAVGAIPVINYPEWFAPSLEHMETCILFDGKEDLVAKIRNVLEMDSTHIARMRQNVIDYYEKHLRPEPFIGRIESSGSYKVTILMMAEAYVARNALKLNRYSVLMRGATGAVPSKWRRLLALAGSS